MGFWRPVVLLVAVAFTMSPSPVGATTVPPVVPTRATNPVLLLPSTSFVPGESVVVNGSGWTLGAVNVQVCGNGGLGGSPSCDMPTSRNAQANSAGDFSIMLEIAPPPRPCPCVIVARGLTNEENAVTPIAIEGHPVADRTPVKGPEDAGTTVSLAISLRGERSWGDYFGTGPTRQLSLRITNTGRMATGAGTVDVSVGKDFPPTGFGSVVDFESIAPGETRIIEVELTLDVFAYGDYWVAAVMNSPRVGAATGTTTSSFPSGLLASLVALVLLIDVAVIRRVRRRARANREDLAAEAAAKQDIDGTPSSMLRPGRTGSPTIPLMPAAFPVVGTEADEASADAGVSVGSGDSPA